MIEWEVDDRPATPWTRLYLRGMHLRRDDRAFSGEEHTRRTAQQLQDRGDRPPTLLTRLAVRTGGAWTGGLWSWSAAPRRRAPAARVLYVHGGGYVHPLTADYWRLVRALVRTPAEVHVPAYPLAPGATVDDVLPRLVELAEHLGRDGLPLVLMGDSAGGALVLATARVLRERGEVRPSLVVPLCPWLDATLSDEEVADLEPSDPMLAESGLRAAGRWWAGVRRPEDPLVSPVSAPPAGRVSLWIGDRDILRPAVDRFVARAEGTDCDLTVHEVTAMFHVWMTRAVPEARRTRAALVAALRDAAG